MFEFDFMAYLIEHDPREVLINDAREKAKNKKIYSILIATLKLSQFIFVNKTLTLAQAWLALKLFYQKKGRQYVLMFIENCRHTKMVNRKDLYEHLMTMSNLADQLEEVIIMDEDFMTTICFSIIEISRYSNIVKIIINGLLLQRTNLINKLIATEQQHHATKKRPLKFHTTMQALDKRKRKRKKGTYINYKKERHFAKECQFKPRRSCKERAKKVNKEGKEFVFTI